MTSILKGEEYTPFYQAVIDADVHGDVFTSVQEFELKHGDGNFIIANPFGTGDTGFGIKGPEPRPGIDKPNDWFTKDNFLARVRVE